MRRHLLAAAVVAADTAIVAAARPGWALPLFAAAAVAVVLLGRRRPVAAFVAAMVLAPATGAAYLLSMWASFGAGGALAGRTRAAVVAGAATGGLAVQLVVRADGLERVPQTASAHVVFVALPLLAGRYLAQQRRLVATLAQRTRQLELERELLTERERLRERLRIARDMHDSLGHRLSLVSVQAAALEVSRLPPREQETARHVAASARAAMSELYELVGALRGAYGTGSAAAPGVAAIEPIVEECRAAGLPVAFRQRGVPLPLSPAASGAAYRVAEEGLTNAVKHAPGQPVTVSISWEPDAVLLTVVSAPAGPPAGAPPPGGHGLTGLAERVAEAGGLFGHGRTDDGFRLFAMLPAAPGPPPRPAPPDRAAARTVALGFATAALMFFVLPASLLLGAR